MARRGHLDMLVADWNMVPGYWKCFLREHPGHPASNKMNNSIPCTLYCFLSYKKAFPGMGT